MSLAVLIFSAWGVGEGSGCQTFSVPANATKIGDLDLYIVGTKVDKLPTPSTGTSAPTIVEITAHVTGPYTFAMNFEVESETDVEYVYLSFGSNGTYKAKVRPQDVEGGNDTPITACGVVAQQQGVTCTAACLYACSCLVCPDKQVELNAEQACAYTCTTTESSGVLASAPYYGSEKNLASVLYHGLPELGTTGLATQLGCSASSCEEAPKPGVKRRKGVSLDFSTPITLSTATLSDSMVTTTPNDSVPAQYSQTGGAATIGISKCPANAMC